MQNTGNVITRHSNNLLFQSFKHPTRMCNCKDKASFPMVRNCLQKSFVYQPRIVSPNPRKYYLGTSEDEFKTRYKNHTMFFRNKGYKKETELSKYV